MFDPQFVTQPCDHGFTKDVIRARKHLHAGQQEAFKFDERLFKKSDIVQIPGLNPACGQTEINSMLRKFVIMFLSSKTFLFCGGDQLTISYESCSCIVKITGNAKYVHITIAQGPASAVVHRLLVSRSSQGNSCEDEVDH